RHAVDAAQVAVVDHRDAEVVDDPPEAICELSRGLLRPRAVGELHLPSLRPIDGRGAIVSAWAVRIRVRLFASLRESVGQGELELELPEGGPRGGVWQRLAAAHPELGLRRGPLAAAVTRRYASFDEPLSAGDEVVFIPPVSGG